MGAYVRKTKDIYELVTNYGYGEEVEYTADNQKEIHGVFLDYRNEKIAGYLPELVSIRIRHRRVRKEKNICY